MGCDNEKDDEPGKEKSLKTVKTLDVPTNLLPVYDRDANRKEDEGCGENQEIGREKEAERIDEAIKKVIRIERLKPQVKETPSNRSRSICNKPRLGRLGRPRPFFQEPELSEVLDELL